MLKFINDTPSIIHISDFIFVPGESEIQDMTKEQYEFFKLVEANDDEIKEAVKAGKVKFEWDGRKTRKFEPEQPKPGKEKE